MHHPATLRGDVIGPNIIGLNITERNTREGKTVSGERMRDREFAQLLEAALKHPNENLGKPHSRHIG
jgi:hypothetical protein